MYNTIFCSKSRLAVVLNKETSSSYLITHFQVTLYRLLRVLYFYELRRLQNSMISQVRSLASLKSSLKQNRKLVRKLNRGKPRNEDLEYAQLESECANIFVDLSTFAFLD